MIRAKGNTHSGQAPAGRSPQQPTIRHLWKIRINDGYCEYEYQLPSILGSACILDIYELVRKALHAPKRKGKRIPLE